MEILWMVFHFIEPGSLTGQLWEPDVLCGESPAITLSLACSFQVQQCVSLQLHSHTPKPKLNSCNCYLLTLVPDTLTLLHSLALPARVLAPYWKCETATVAVLTASASPCWVVLADLPVPAQLILPQRHKLLLPPPPDPRAPSAAQLLSASLPHLSRLPRFQPQENKDEWIRMGCQAVVEDGGEGTVRRRALTVV